MSEQVQEDAVKKGGNKNVVIVATIAVVIILALIGVILFLLKPQEKEKRNAIVNKDNVDKIVESMLESDSFRVPTYYEAKMNSTWYFADGKSASSNAYVENVKTNTNDIYFDVLRTDTNETIYQSPLIPVGSYIDEVTLDTELSAGTYDCMLTYHLVDEEQNSLTTVNFTLTIIIDN